MRTSHPRRCSGRRRPAARVHPDLSPQRGEPGPKQDRWNRPFGTSAPDPSRYVALGAPLGALAGMSFGAALSAGVALTLLGAALGGITGAIAGLLVWLGLSDLPEELIAPPAPPAPPRPRAP